MAGWFHDRLEARQSSLVHALVARRLAGTTEGVVVGLICGFVILALFGAQFLTPRDVLLGALVLVPVLAAAWSLSAAWSISIGVMAITSRLAITVIEDENPVTGLVEMATLVVLFLAVRAVGRDPAMKEGPRPVGIGTLGTTQMHLTGRERDVVNLALQGMTAREIGIHLFIGQRTVESHLAHAYKKLGVTSKLQLVRQLKGPV